MKKRIGIILMFVVSVCLLVVSISNLKAVQKKHETAVYQIEGGVSGETVEAILHDNTGDENEDELNAGKINDDKINDSNEITDIKNANSIGVDFINEQSEQGNQSDGAKKIVHNLVFYMKGTNQSISHAEWNRTVTADVIKLYGDSAILYPYTYPLDPEDERGCLLGEQTAWELFGSDNPVSTRIVYDGNTYEIRGIIEKENVLVLEGGTEEAYSHLIYAQADLYLRNKMISRIQNLYGLWCTELPFRFYIREAKFYVVLSALLLYSLTAIFFCRRFSKLKRIKMIKKLALLGGVFGILIGFFYILSLSAYTLPDQVSDLAWWSSYFQNEWTEYRSFTAHF